MPNRSTLFITMHKTTTLELSEAMQEIKNSFPDWKDGGPKHEEIYQAGLLKFKNEYKFSRENELFDLLKEIFN